LARRPDARRRRFPHFFLATGDFFCPTLKITRDNGQLRITTDEDSIATFIDLALRT